MLAPTFAQLSSVLTCAVDGPSYSVASSGSSLFTSSLPLRIFTNGSWSASWTRLSVQDVEGEDALGGFNGTECAYGVAGDVNPVITVSIYDYGGLVRFAYTLPQGLAATKHTAGGSVDDDPPGASFSTITNFPGFNGSSASLPNVLTWHESFVTPDTAMASAYGQRGGPVVLYGADVSGTVVLLSPLGSFLETAFGDATAAGPCTLPGCLTAGISSTFESLPPGFEQSFVLVARGGVTATVAAWGAYLKVGVQAKRKGVRLAVPPRFPPSPPSSSRGMRRPPPRCATSRCRPSATRLTMARSCALAARGHWTRAC